MPVNLAPPDPKSLLPVKDSLEAAISIPAATTEQMLEGVHARCAS